MKLAAIDVGSNSIHLIIARICARGMIEIIDRDKEVARLGAGTLRTGSLSDEAMDRGLAALRQFSRIASRHKVDDILAVATSAVREATNGGSFLERVKKETGIDVRVVTGSEEARLIYLGAREVIDFRGRDALIVDIGGGSMELILGNAERLRFTESMKLGVIRLTDRFVHEDPLLRDSRIALESFVRGQAEQILKDLNSMGFGQVVGTSGTLVNLVSTAFSLAGQPVPETSSLTQIDTETLNQGLKRIILSSRENRLKIPGLDPQRVDTIVAGAVLVQVLLEITGAESFSVCDRALREGLVADYVQRHRPGIRLSETIPDLRRRSVIHLARRCGTYSLHVLRVSRLCDPLFDQLQSLHRLGEGDRDLLRFAALLVDSGFLIDSENHHKHGYYLIRNCPLAGFFPSEIEIMANVVRYHRKALPRSKHDGFGALGAADRFRVRLLGGILRMAAGLDRSHNGVVTGLTCIISRDRLEIQVTVREDGELEVWTANRRSELLEKALGIPVLVTRSQVTAPSDDRALWQHAEKEQLDPEGLAQENEA